MLALEGDAFSAVLRRWFASSLIKLWYVPSKIFLAIDVNLLQGASKFSAKPNAMNHFMIGLAR